MASASVLWAGGKKFLGTDSTQHSVVISTPGEGVGMKPSDLLLVALAGCTAVDVVDILEKKRHQLVGLEIRVSAEQDDDADESADGALPLPAGQKNYLTPGGYARLKSELDRLVDRERPAYLIFLTDGLPTLGETRRENILSNFAQAAPASVRLFPFGVGNDVDTFLLDSLAQEPDQQQGEEVRRDPRARDRSLHLVGLLVGPRQGGDLEHQDSRQRLDPVEQCPGREGLAMELHLQHGRRRQDSALHAARRDIHPGDGLP